MIRKLLLTALLAALLTAAAGAAALAVASRDEIARYRAMREM
jgi:hypothetical protein